MSHTALAPTQHGHSFEHFALGLAMDVLSPIREADGGWLQDWEDVYVVTGPLYLPTKTNSSWTLMHPMIGHPPSMVAVPTHFFKVRSKFGVYKGC